MIFYESPYRLVKTLDQFIEYFGPERECSVAREISKSTRNTNAERLRKCPPGTRNMSPRVR